MTKPSPENPRPWTGEDFDNRKAHMRAVPILVLERWEREGGAPGADRLTTDEIQRELVARGFLEEQMPPQAAGAVIGGFVQKQIYRNLVPPFVVSVDKGIWHFNVRYYERELRKFRERYPIMAEGVPVSIRRERQVSVEELPDVQTRSLVDKILQTVGEYERDWRERLQDAENRARFLEQENSELRERLRESSSALGEISDEILRKRIGALLESPLDTMIREAGVVLEDRLRAVGEAGSDLEGVRLVDALLIPEKGKLVFSSHPGEQEGVRMLYRGAMQFIRNPPMHKLIEYPEDTARLLIRLIDSLLQLLSEGEPRQVE